MKARRYFFSFSLALAATLFAMQTTGAQAAGFSMPAAPGAQTVTAEQSQQAGAIANSCLSNWQAPVCLRAVSAASLVLASNYGAALQQSGHPNEAENIKQHCAAATAATQGDYPAYAMKSAFTECANTIGDVAGQTGVAPDPTQYQMLIGPVLCLSADPRCSAVTAGMQAYAGR